jgi:sterol 3beta-glucosyltransferase
MKITILTFGSRGDVEPFMALSLGLQRAGFEVTLGADVDFEQQIRALGINYTALRLNLRQFLNSEQGKAAMAGVRDAEAVDMFETMSRPMLDDCWAAAQGADALIYDTMLCTAAWHIAETLMIPAMMASTMPNMSPTRQFPAIGVPRIPFGGFGNWLTYQIYRIDWVLRHRKLKRWCEATLGVRPRSRFINYRFRRGRPIPVLYAYSQHVLPSPSDWNKNTLASGYWFLASDHAWTPPEALRRFLEHGPPPIYVGFGSTVGLNPERTTQIVAAATVQAGQRAVLVSGWGGLDARVCGPSDHILCIDQVPFTWLFPRVKAVVHHGGAGTAAAGLRFGKPNVACPFVTDQFFWADIIHRNGWGPQSVPHRQLSVERLSQAITMAVGDPRIRQRTEELGKKLQAEDGVARAVQFIKMNVDGAA